MSSIITQNKLITYLSFGIVAASIIAVGLACYSSAIKMSHRGENLEAIAMMVAYVVLTLGSGQAGKEIRSLLEKMHLLFKNLVK